MKWLIPVEGMDENVTAIIISILAAVAAAGSAWFAARANGIARQIHADAGWDRLMAVISPLMSVDIMNGNPQPLIAELRTAAASLNHRIPKIGTEIQSWLFTEQQVGLVALSDAMQDGPTGTMSELRRRRQPFTEWCAILFKNANDLRSLRSTRKQRPMVEKLLDDATNRFLEVTAARPDLQKLQENVEQRIRPLD